jgi:hypothetical protein
MKFGGKLGNIRFQILFHLKKYYDLGCFGRLESAPGRHPFFPRTKI